MRILVVDDEQDICNVLRFNLLSVGYEVELAYSAEEALTLDLSKVDLIILDVMMGEMSGFEFIQHIRKEPATQRIPVIFLTAKSEEKDKLLGFEYGADDYMVKPFSVRELLARVKTILKRKESADSSLEPIVYREITLENNRDGGLCYKFFIEKNCE